MAPRWRSTRPMLRTRRGHESLRWLSARSMHPKWYPQGIDVGMWRGRRTLAVSWFRKDASGTEHLASRITFVDLRRGTSVDVALAVEGDTALEPARIHAGGLAWIGDRLLVAATHEGLWEFDTSDVVDVRGADARRLAGSRLPALGARASALVRVATHDVPLRCSFVGRVVDEADASDRVMVGEYRTDDDGRIAEHVLPAGDAAWDAWAPQRAGVRRMQGVVRLGDRVLVSQSRAMTPGALWQATMRDGTVGELRRTRVALPVGCEDLAIDVETQTLWTLGEHPWRRVVRGIPLADVPAPTPDAGATAQ